MKKTAGYFLRSACRENGTYPYIHWLCMLSNAIVGGLGLK